MSDQRQNLSTTAASSIYTWQVKLLPWMVGLLLGLTLFFLGASVYQVFRLQDDVRNAPTISVPHDLQGIATQRDRDSEKWLYLARLEEYTIDRRYHQADRILMSRIWVIYLGFLTGMILSLVGASFILGKLAETQSKLSAGTSTANLTIQSSSPGLVLTVVGSALMITTMLAHVSIDVEDAPVYLSDRLMHRGIQQQENQSAADKTMKDLTKNP